MPAGLDTARRTAALRAGFCAPYPGTDTLSTLAAGPGDGDQPGGDRLAPVVHLADRADRPACDAAERRGHTAPIDAQNRISLGKVLGRLGWDAGTFLIAFRENGHVVVRATADSPHGTPVPVDTQRRLTLPPAVLAGLDVRRGDQVQAAAVVDTGELHLFAAADALQILTGPLPIIAAPTAAPEPARPAAASGRSRVKARWTPADVRAAASPVPGRPGGRGFR